MKVLIIGSGLLGVTTAYCLARRGCEVTVLERGPGAGLETSFANGSLLHPSMPEPWNSPGCWRVLARSLFDTESALLLRLRALPSLAGWGVTFLRNSKVHIAERNALSNLRLALYSLKAMARIREQIAIEYGRTARGTLRLFRDPAALDQASAVAERLSREGLRSHRLSTHETLALEPALTPIGNQLAGALHYLGDESGNAYQFCEALAEYARQAGAQFRFGTTVDALEIRRGQVTAVICDQDRFVADRYIVAAGSYSTLLLRRAGVALPVQPAKGYSITFSVPPGQPYLGVPVLDDDWHAAVVPLEGAIRVAGTAEFAGYDQTVNADRIRNLSRLMKRVLPDAPFDPASGRPWCGLRPMSADGVPIIGPTPIPNLLVNTGHGPLGWTMAAGSGQLLADLLCAAAPEIDPAPYALKRFGD